MAPASVLPKLVGQRVKRREDPRLIQGRGTYVDDVKIPGMQHLAFKRSDIAHGRIRSIDTRAAGAMDGVEAVFTGAQVAGFLAPMPIGTPYPSPEHRAVAVDTVRFVGDPVAVVVACDRYVARDAADSIVVRAIAPEVGGGFGAKINIYGEEYVAVALSRRLGLPVKWIEDRSEAFLATVHGRDLIPYVELAATRDGKVLGLRMRIIADIGAYNMLLTARVPTHSMTMANATYAFPAVRATLTEVFTNKTPTDAYRGAGRPEATYFVERAMDMLARELGMDPASLRRRNFIQPDQFPYQTQMGAVYDSGDYEKALDRALGVAGWEELTRERDAARADGRLVGLGLSMYVESCGLGPSSTLPPGGWEHSQVTVERDGRIPCAVAGPAGWTPVFALTPSCHSVVLRTARRRAS